MAGIKEAEERIRSRKHRGKVTAKGIDIYGDHYMIINVRNRKGTCSGQYHLAVDSGSDVRFQSGIKREDDVVLRKLDNYSAEWQKDE